MGVRMWTLRSAISGARAAAVSLNIESTRPL